MECLECEVAFASEFDFRIVGALKVYYSDFILTTEFWLLNKYLLVLWHWFYVEKLFTDNIWCFLGLHLYIYESMQYRKKMLKGILGGMMEKLKCQSLFYVRIYWRYLGCYEEFARKLNLLALNTQSHLNSSKSFTFMWKHLKKILRTIELL